MDASLERTEKGNEALNPAKAITFNADNPEVHLFDPSLPPNHLVGVVEAKLVSEHLTKQARFFHSLEKDDCHMLNHNKIVPELEQNDTTISKLEKALIAMDAEKKKALDDHEEDA
uniref:Uncharacterized protein n=1 Tax=Cannabis sativa TaxID=3483 RepID=A0A803QG33_CANSA